MTLIDYIKQCMKDEGFRKVWEEENSDLDPYLFDESLSNNVLSELEIREALRLLEASDLNDIIKNRGIKTNSISNTEIEFYEESNGDCPVEEFLENISNNKLKIKTLRNIAELSIRGGSAKPPLSVYIDDGIFELRTKQGSNIDRIFYFFILGNKVVMTNGYIKKSQKIDSREFERAKRYRDRYLGKIK